MFFLSDHPYGFFFFNADNVEDTPLDAKDTTYWEGNSPLVGEKINTMTMCKL